MIDTSNNNRPLFIFLDNFDLRPIKDIVGKDIYVYINCLPIRNENVLLQGVNGTNFIFYDYDNNLLLQGKTSYFGVFKYNTELTVCFLDEDGDSIEEQILTEQPLLCSVGSVYEERYKNLFIYD